jgi:hypothetical protein
MDQVLEPRSWGPCSLKQGRKKTKHSHVPCRELHTTLALGSVRTPSSCIRGHLVYKRVIDSVLENIAIPVTSFAPGPGTAELGMTTGRWAGSSLSHFVTWWNQELSKPSPPITSQAVLQLFRVWKKQWVDYLTGLFRELQRIMRPAKRWGWSLSS